MYRPCAFFLTDGVPNDREWHQTFAAQLTYDRKTRRHEGTPDLRPVRFQASSGGRAPATGVPRDRGKWYHAKTDDVDQALKGILEIIMNTVVASPHSAGPGQPDIAQQPPHRGRDEQGESSRAIRQYDPDYVVWRRLMPRGFRYR